MIQTLAGVSIAIFMLAGIALAVAAATEGLDGKVIPKSVAVSILALTAVMVLTIAANAILEVTK